MKPPAKPSQKRKKFESDVAFEIVSFTCDDSERYTAAAQQLGYESLKEFLEDECQRALFALTVSEEFPQSQPSLITINKISL